MARAAQSNDRADRILPGGHTVDAHRRWSRVDLLPRQRGVAWRDFIISGTSKIPSPTSFEKAVLLVAVSPAADSQLDLSDRSILITGGTGSFGRRFAATVLRNYRPRRLIIFSRDELKQHEMRQSGVEGGVFTQPAVRFFLGDVRDVDRLRRAMQGVDVVVHAAALKQVPACEYNPFEAVLTNIMGARNIIEAAIDRGVKRVLALSTDKAVNPVNLYGATKLCAEKLFVQGNAYSGAEERASPACAMATSSVAAAA